MPSYAALQIDPVINLADTPVKQRRNGGAKPGLPIKRHNDTKT